jgi:CobW/HypB/UreG, nucleotide-binding domain
MSSAQIYFILGPAGAGRRAVLADLLANGLDPTARPALLSAATEAPADAAAEQSLAAVKTLARGVWSMADDRLIADVPAGATHVFVLSDGRANPVDQVEAFHAWLPSSGGELARVITVVDCKAGSEHTAMVRWYDACVHFSDVVLLNRREGVSNKWVADFVARFRKQHFPCLIEFVKHSEIANPALILEPQARRMSLLFDDTAPLTVTISEGGDDDEDDGDDGTGEVVDDDGAPVDPYIERLAGSGRRAKEIPDIRKILSG